MMESHWKEKLISLKEPIANNEENQTNENDLLEENKDERVHSKSLKICINSSTKKKVKIYDNILEDIIIYKPKKYSMKNLKSKINYNNIFNVNNKNKVQEDNKNKDVDKVNKNIIINEVSISSKDSYIFSNIIKLKKEKNPKLLIEQWKYEKILLDYNIIDFTCKQNKIIIII